MEEEVVELFDIVKLTIEPEMSQLPDSIDLSLIFKPKQNITGHIWQLSYMIDTVMKR